MQELNRNFGNISISPRPSAALRGKIPLSYSQEFEHQARQNICTQRFSAASNNIISEWNLIMENCSDSIKATAKQSKNQIQEGADPESAMRNAYKNT